MYMPIKRVCALARMDTNLNNEVFVWLRCILSLQMLVKLVSYCLIHDQKSASFFAMLREKTVPR